MDLRELIISLAPTLTAFGEVIDDSPLTIRVNGDTEAITGFMQLQAGGTAYTPAVGHTVGLILFGTRWAVAGRLT